MAFLTQNFASQVAHVARLDVNDYFLSVRVCSFKKCFIIVPFLQDTKNKDASSETSANKLKKSSPQKNGSLQMEIDLVSRYVSLSIYILPVFFCLFNLK